MQEKAQENLGKQDQVIDFLSHQSGTISGAINPLCQNKFKTGQWK